MPSSSFISPLGSTQRKVFDPKTGLQVPYKPYMTPASVSQEYLQSLKLENQILF